MSFYVPQSYFRCSFKSFALEQTYRSVYVLRSGRTIRVLILVITVRDPSYTLAHRFSGIPSQWQYVQEIAHQSGMFNSPNWAYFGLLAALADYGYQLSEVPDEERKGRLVKNSDIIRS